MVCLDTSFIIDVLRGSSEAKRVLDNLAAQAEEISIAAPTLMELQTGLSLNTRGAKEAELIDQIKTSSTILPLDDKSATLAGEIEAGLILAGETLPPVDIMIAAIAIRNGEDILTKNVRHFKRIDGLAVRSP